MRKVHQTLCLIDRWLISAGRDGGPQAQPHGGILQKRFPKHHRRRRPAEQSLAQQPPPQSRDRQQPQQQAQPEAELNRVGFGIIDWADAVLQRLDEGGGWASCTPCRRTRTWRLSHDELSRITRSRASTQVTGEATREAASRRSTPQPRRLPERCVTESPRNEMPSAPPKLSRLPIRSSHAFVAPSKSPPLPLLGPLRSAGPCTPGPLRNAPAPLACIRARFRGDLHVHACAFGVGGVLAAFPRACDVMCCVRESESVSMCGGWQKLRARRMGFMAGGRGQCVSATRCSRLLRSTPPVYPSTLTVSQSSLNQCARFSSQCNETRR